MDKENQHKKVSNVKKSSKKPIHKSPTKTKNSASQSQNSIVGQILKDIQKTFKFKIDAKTIKMNIPMLLFVWAGDKISQAWFMSNGNLQAFLMVNINKCLSDLTPSFNIRDIGIGIAVAAGIKIIMYVKKKNAKKYRHKEEYGSARWGTEKDIEPYMDSEDFSNNVILTQTERLTMESRPKSGVKYARNKNIVVVGGSGSGKTRFFVKPNIMQMHSSYVVTDPKGTVLPEVGKMLEKNGYKIKVLNTIDFSKSMHYNPFAYIHNEEDILKLVTTLINNTKGDGDKSGEDFWVKAEKLLYTAYIGLIWYEFPYEERNMSTLVTLINASETSEDDETYENSVDKMFKALEETRGADHFAVKQYHKYKLAAGKTAKSILISCGARLSPFDIAALSEIMSYDEMDFADLGHHKTALFIIVSDTTDTFNFVVAMLYTQLFNVLCTEADTNCKGGRLEVPVRCLLDEFANIGQIPNFDKLIATIRSREISASIILQSQSQLKAIYKDNADTILGNCDTMLFLGGKEKSTLKEMSEMLGKQTIDLYNTSENRGQSQSYGLNYNKTGRELMSQDELAVMDGSKCILQIRGVRPFFSDKFDITKHSKYTLLSDYNEKNTFDVVKYMERYRKELTKMKTAKNEEIVCDKVISCSKEKAETLISENEAKD